MSDLKLISVDLSYDCGEPGDKIYITTKWQNCGETPDFNAQIAIDFIFADRQRRDAAEIENFKLLWTPFPCTYQWKKGDVWTTTGIWQVPKTWGGSYQVKLSLVDENGATVEFIGRNGKNKMCEYLCDFDIAWGYGRHRLLAQRKPINLSINSLSNLEPIDTITDYIDEKGFKFSKNYISICGYKDKNWIDFKPVINVRKISDNSFYSCIGNNGTVYTAKKNEKGLIYDVSTEYCNFQFVITSYDDHLEFDITNLTEKEDFELISLEIPSLTQLSELDTVFTNFYGGGRRIKLNKAVTQSVEFYYDVCNILAASSEKETFCLEATDVDNILRQSVIKNINDNKCVNLGAIIRKHIPADKKGLKSISVDLKPLKLWFNNNGDWQISAQILKRQLNGDYPQIYNNTLMYKIMLDASGQYHPEKDFTEQFINVTKLADIKETILRVYHLSGGMRQVVYLIGWQTGGHDFEYPYPHRRPFNPNCGTLEEFNVLREELKAYNVDLSLHDNFDDAYLSDTYELNDELLCHDKYGNRWKGWMWAGGMSYLLCPKEYVDSSDINERIDSVVNDYGIDRTYHLDVLSSEVLRYNFNPNKQSNAWDNIVAKTKIIDKFNEKGIDITSESLIMPFVGKLGYAHCTRYRFDSTLFYGEELVPLTTIAFHGTMPYGFGAGESLESQLRSIAVGAASSFNLESDSTTRTIMRNIYISTLPMSKLAYKRVIDATSSTEKWIVNYSDNSSVFVDFKNCNYKITLDGNIISENFTTFMPIDENTYCYYSASGSKFEKNLPIDWNSATVFEVTENGETERFKLSKNNGFVFETKTDAPYIIRKDS